MFSSPRLLHAASDLNPAKTARPTLKRWCVATLVFLVGLAVFVWKVKIAGPIAFIGLADPAGYAEMADSLISGRMLEVDYISMHFRKFNPGISHPEDTWPPFYSFLIVPFFLWLGKTAFAAKLPSLLISCFGLPLMTSALARRVTRSETVALASALSILLYEPVFSWSLFALADLVLAFFVICATLFALKGIENPKWFLPMGAAMALGFYSKGLALIIAPAFVCFYILHAMRPRPRPLTGRHHRFFILGAVLFVLLLMPWLIRNTILFKDPLYCSHKHVAGYVGWEDWKDHSYGLYWDREPPGAFDKISQPRRLLEKSIEFFLLDLRLLFLQKDSRIFVMGDLSPGPFTFRDISTYWIGIPAALGMLLYLFCAAYRALLRMRRVQPDRSRILNAVEPYALREYGLFILIGLFLVAFLSMLWIPNPRYNVSIIPMVMIMGWATLRTITGQILSRTRLPRFAAGALLLALFAVWAHQEHTDLVYARNNAMHPWKEGGKTWTMMADWIKQNIPGSVIMTSRPWGVHFSSGNKTVQLPFARIEDLIKVAKYYNVTHIIPDKDHLGLLPLTRGIVPGFKELHRVRDNVLYEIEYAKLLNL